MGVTEELAQFITDTRYEALPSRLVEAAKIAILDGIGNMLAGATQPLVELVSRHIQTMGGTPTCSVVGRGYKTNPAQAAFANGVSLHCLDFEIQGSPPTHGTSACLPPALALGEVSGITGKRLIEAYVVGWEVQARLRHAAARADLRGFHPPGLFGPMGAVAASARVLALNQQQVCMALGIAASHTGGLTANTGTMVKSTHPGAAARHGVEAALLASEGFISHGAILEAPQGYVEVLFGETFDWELLTRDLGTTFQLVESGFNIKRYPAQIFMQWPIEAVCTLQQKYHLRLEDVAYLELEVPQARGDRSIPQPKSGLEGKFSFEYCGAVALAYGRVDLDSFSDATRFSPQVEEALRKVRLKFNPAIPADPRRTWAVARIGTKDGQVYSEQCRSYRGAVANPMSREERLEKVRMCASRVLSSEDTERIITQVEALEELDDLRLMMTILCQCPSSRSSRL
jgi:2-methylcitrate dehydratase PrpD